LRACVSAYMRVRASVRDCVCARVCVYGRVLACVRNSSVFRCKYSINLIRRCQSYPGDGERVNTSTSKL